MFRHAISAVQKINRNKSENNLQHRHDGVAWFTFTGFVNRHNTVFPFLAAFLVDKGYFRNDRRRDIFPRSVACRGASRSRACPGGANGVRVLRPAQPISLSLSSS